MLPDPAERLHDEDAPREAPGTIRSVGGLLASGHEVTVIGYAVCGVQPGLEEELRSRWGRRHFRAVETLRRKRGPPFALGHADDNVAAVQAMVVICERADRPQHLMSGGIWIPRGLNAG